MKRFYVILILFFVSCSSDNDPVTVIEQEDPPKANSVPDNFNFTDVSFAGNLATIDWEDAIDQDNDQIYYKLYIDNVLIGEYTVSIANVHNCF